MVFVAFAFAAKEIRVLYVHSPWEDDPYDAVVSFTIFFVPLLIGLCIVRVPLCRRQQPLPISRVVGLLRGSRVVLGAVLLTLIADWIAVAVRANVAAWNSSTALWSGSSL